jgi:hypothetical protein
VVWVAEFAGELIFTLVPGLESVPLVTSMEKPPTENVPEVMEIVKE